MGEFLVLGQELFYSWCMDNKPINLDSEVYDYETRKYITPTISRDEQTAFIDALRNNISKNTAQINQQTENLGTQIPSIQGGLTGSSNYFVQRYQTPQMESTASQLKATAQAKALEDLMSNYKAQMANRVQQAYRAASRRSSYGTNTGTDTSDDSGDIPTTEPSSSETSFDMVMPTTGWPEGMSVKGYGTINNERFYQNADTGEVVYTDSSNWAQDSNGIYRYIANWRANSRYNGWSDQQLADLTAAGKQPAVENKIATPAVNERASTLSGGGDIW